jgi:polyhydroxyalkanoate synthase
VTTTLDVELAEAGDLAGAPLDLLLTDAVKGNWQRFAPDTTVLRTAGRLANRPRKLLGRVGGPPGNKKANYRTADHNPADASAWLAAAEQHEGSWWPDFSSWLHARTGELVTAPTQLGDHDHPVLSEAPGTYVYIR